MLFFARSIGIPRMSKKNTRYAILLGVIVLASSVQASPQDASTPVVAAAVVSDADQARALAVTLRAAIDATVANDYPDDAAAQQAAITNSLQTAIIGSGASPLVALSAVSAVLYCPSGGIPATAGGEALIVVGCCPNRAIPATEGGDALVDDACSGGLAGAIDTPTRTALEALLAQISALLAGEQPAALAGGFFGGLGFPPAAGLTAGGSDYIG